MNVNLCFMRGLALFVYFQMDIILGFMRGLALFASNGCQSVSCEGLYCLLVIFKWMSICVSCEGLHCLLVYIQMDVTLCFMRGLALFVSLHSNGCQSMFHARACIIC